MTADLTISEKVVCRLLEAAWSHYLTLPAERRDEAMEFRRKLDDAAAVVKMRPAHRSVQEGAGELPPIEIIAGGARPQKRKRSATAATVPSAGSTKSLERISA